MRRSMVILFLLLGLAVFGQHQDKVDFLNANVRIIPNALEKSISGTVEYTFKVLEAVDSVFLDAHQMNFENVFLNSKEVPFRNTDSKLILDYNFKAGRNYRLKLQYAAVPKKTLYYIGFDDTITGNEQLWTQGQGKYTSHWLPSIDDMQEKVVFDLTIVYDENYTVIANGRLKDTQVLNGLKQWNFDMESPMSSYLVAFSIGVYDKQELRTKRGINIENYYYPSDAMRVEPTYRYTEQIFDFLEAEIGVAYPWQNYKQVPVHDFLYAGMENTTATFFSDAFVIDSIAFVDKNYVNVNAHELAHQWFGNLVTEKSGEHHWLQEGFATYYAYLAEKEVFGDDYFYWKLFDTAKVLEERETNGEGESLLNPNASSLTFYEKGAWALVMLKERVGPDNFKIGIQNFLRNYQFKNATVSDFIMEMERVSGKDLNEFETTWLKSIDFPIEEVKDFFNEHSASIRTFYVLKPTIENIPVDQKFLRDTSMSRYLKLELSKQKDTLLEVDYLVLLKDDDLKVRQFAAENIGFIPESLKEFAEPLLLDKSYITIELMLFNLWNSFESNREAYLNQTKGIIGFQNKNVRLLWLTLALITTDYDLEQKGDYYQELVQYTSSIYNPETRQMAFQYLNDLKALRGNGLINLIKATNHHSWQFRNFARYLLDAQLQEEGQRNEIESMAKQLNSSDLRYLKTKIKVP